MTFQEATAAVTAPGQMLEIGDAEIGGVTQRVFVNAPPNLRSLFENARSFGDTTFLVYEDERWSFADVMAAVDGLGAALVHHYGVHKGDRVAIAMRNYPEWIVAFAAITAVGAISVSLNSWWTEDEVDYALEDSGATVLIADDARIKTASASCTRLGVRIVSVRTDADFGEGVERFADVVVPGATLPDIAIEPGDDATILYTSGTTGRPKGAVSTHQAVVQALFSFACRSQVERARRGPGESEGTSEAPSFILIVPLFHVTGCIPVMLSCFATGLKLVIMYKWDVDKALELIERERISNFVGVPTQSWDLVHSPRFAEFDTSSLRDVGGGGAPAPPALVERVASSFPKGGPAIGYGMTETNAYGPQNRGDDYLTHPTSTGRAVPTLQIEVRDASGAAVPPGEPGEIWFKGPNLIRGYWNKPEATAETIVDGWLRSGDIGRVDAEGFVYVEDRAKDMILRGGENVYCAEVEAAIYEHSAVHEAAVFGVPDERLGEEVAVAVFLKPGAQLSGDELRAHVAAHLAAFKVPKYVVIRDEPLPRNASGKILKRELAADAADAG